MIVAKQCDVDICEKKLFLSAKLCSRSISNAGVKLLFFIAQIEIRQIITIKTLIPLLLFPFERLFYFVSRDLSFLLNAFH